MSERFDSSQELAVRVIAMDEKFTSDDFEDGTIMNDIVSEIEELESDRLDD